MLKRKNYEHNIDYEKIIQDLQYTNSLLNKRNLLLESQLENIKNKYNQTKQDINDINKHISICKENQNKIISDLKQSKDNINISDDYVNDKVHLFVEKMKMIFNIEIEEDIKDEDYLEKFGNYLIKFNEEFILCRNDLNNKIHEINKLKHEVQNLELNYINMNKYNNKTNNLDINFSKDYYRAKTPVGHDKKNLKPLINIQNNNINQSIDNSPKSLKNKNKYNIPIPKTPQINLEEYNYNKYNNKLPVNNKIEKKLINSHSSRAYKFKTLSESEYDKNINKYLNPETTLNNKEHLNSEEIIQNLMTNMKHLENTLNKNPKNNIYGK